MSHKFSAKGERNLQKTAKIAKYSPSINQSMDKSIHQSFNQSINPPLNQPTNQDNSPQDGKKNGVLVHCCCRENGHSSQSRWYSSMARRRLASTGEVLLENCDWNQPIHGRQSPSLASCSAFRGLWWASPRSSRLSGARVYFHHV